MAHWTMYRGDDRTFTATLEDALEGESGEPILTFMAKASFADDDEDAVIELTSAAGDLALAEDGLSIAVAIPADATDALTRQTRLYWDIQAELDDAVQTVAVGSLDILLDITRAGIGS